MRNSVTFEREPPGPSPLRSLEWPNGLPKKQLTAAQRQQLDEANQLIQLTADVCLAQRDSNRGFWIENPNHREKLDLWKLDNIKDVVNHGLVSKARFDQCAFGAEVTKPTIVAAYQMPIEEIDGQKCDHPIREWTKSDGSKYKAAHESLVQRWRTTDTGKTERASKALAEYPPALSQQIASIMASAGTPRAQKLRQLHGEEIP